jgi:hypothetical protein
MWKKLLLFIIPIFIIAWTPATSTVTTAWTTLCEERVTGSTTVTFKVSNTGPTNPFTDCRVQTWMGPAAADWADVTVTWSTTCSTLAAAGNTWASLAEQSHEKLRVQAKSTSGTTAYCRPYGN